MTTRNALKPSLIELVVLCALLAMTLRFGGAYPVATVVLAVAALVLVGTALLRRRYRLRKDGYLVGPEGRDSIRYDELADGNVRSLIISGEMLTGAPHVVYLPDPESWEKSMPAWAQCRRLEIIERVKKALGTKRYQFDEVRSGGA